jgi:hypothetical protein
MPGMLSLLEPRRGPNGALLSLLQGQAVKIPKKISTERVVALQRNHAIAQWNPFPAVLGIPASGFCFRQVEFLDFLTQSKKDFENSC